MAAMQGLLFQGSCVIISMKKLIFFILWFQRRQSAPSPCSCCLPTRLSSSPTVSAWIWIARRRRLSRSTMMTRPRWPVPVMSSSRRGRICPISRGVPMPGQGGIPARRYPAVAIAGLRRGRAWYGQAVRVDRGSAAARSRGSSGFHDLQDGSRPRYPAERVRHRVVACKAQQALMRRPSDHC